MTNVTHISRERLTSWYENMWGKCDPTLVVSHTFDTYLRHDPSGPATELTGKQYGAICAVAMQDRQTADFQYFLVSEGEFVGALGRLIFTDGRQWDWVQLFRTQDGRLAETWLPAMGVTEPMAYPRPENTWRKDAIYDQDPSSFDGNKRRVQDWFNDLAAGNDVSKHLASTVRWHDIHDADLTLTRDALQARLRDIMQGDKAGGLKLHLIGEGNYVVATGLWTLGVDNRQWNWVQMFQIENGVICRSWINAIGGTDSSIAYRDGSEWTADVLPNGSPRIGSPSNEN